MMKLDWKNLFISIVLQSNIFVATLFGLDNAVYVINIQNSNNYYLWLRVKAASTTTSVIDVKIDGGSETNLDFSDSQHFVWKKLSNSFYLNSGSHQIALRTNTLGTFIDKIILTSDNNYLPTGEGAISTNPSSVSRVWKAIPLNGRGGIPIMGDVNNDGLIDFVVTGQEYLSVYDNSGNQLWERAISGAKLGYVGDGCFYCRPIDIDNDGNVEVVGIICVDNKPYLAAIDGRTGNVKSQLELAELSGEWYYDANQIANLRGLDSPQDFIIKSVDGGYVPFNLSAYKFENGQFGLMWEFISEPGETRAGCHRPKVFDIDEDGADEIMFGHWCLEQDGSIKWEKPYGFFDVNNHVDSQRPGDIIPWLPGIEIAYASGSLILDYNGNVVWRKDIFDGQSVALAEMRTDLPGLEVLIAYQEPHNDERLFSADGTLLWTFDGAPQYAASYETYPICWIGDEGKESVRQEWGRDRSPSIYDEYNNLVVRLTPEYDYGEIGYRPCDVTGDYRDELICFNTNYIIIYENIAPNSRSYPSPWNDPIYRENQYNWVYY